MIKWTCWFGHFSGLGAFGCFTGLDGLCVSLDWVVCVLHWTGWFVCFTGLGGLCVSLDWVVCVFH